MILSLTRTGLNIMGCRKTLIKAFPVPEQEASDCARKKKDRIEGASYVGKKEEKIRTGYFGGELVSELPDRGICGGERHMLLFLSLVQCGDG